jgi:hypothetical protein
VTGAAGKLHPVEADMTTLSDTKLTDTQLIALSGATQRQDGVVSLPDRVKGMAANQGIFLLTFSHLHAD